MFFVWCILNYYNMRDLFHLLQSHIYIFSFILYLHHLVPWSSTLLASFHAVGEHIHVQWSRLCSRAQFRGLDVHKHLTCYIVLSDIFCTVAVFWQFPQFALPTGWLVHKILSVSALLHNSVLMFMLPELFQVSVMQIKKDMAWLECGSCYSK